MSGDIQTNFPQSNLGGGGGGGGIELPIAMADVTGLTAALAGKQASPLSANDIPPPAAYFGNGRDGDVTISAPGTTLFEDMYYNNLTLTGNATLFTQGYRIFVAGTLDISGLTSGYIEHYSGQGGNSPGATGGTGETSFATNLPGGGNGGNGATGATGSASAGVSSAIVQALTCANGGLGGHAGASGSAAGAAAAAAAAGAISGTCDFRYFTALPVGKPIANISNILTGPAVFGGGAGGRGGHGGAGDSGQYGGGGGGGGRGGGVLWISARTINRGPSTNAGAIRCDGGRGGNAGNGQGGNTGGGSGGGGGGGGWILLFYGTLTGSTATGCLQAMGGAGGNGGNGAGTGTGGQSGGGGNSGRVMALCLANGNVIGSSANLPSNRTLPTSASGATGGASAAATTLRYDL